MLCYVSNDASHVRKALLYTRRAALYENNDIGANEVKVVTVVGLKPYLFSSSSASPMEKWFVSNSLSVESIPSIFQNNWKKDYLYHPY